MKIKFFTKSRERGAKESLVCGVIGVGSTIETYLNPRLQLGLKGTKRHNSRRSVDRKNLSKLPQT